MKLGRLLGLLVCAALVAPASAWAGGDTADTHVVNSNLDPGDGTCTVAPPGCTLQEAIDASNADDDATVRDRINIVLPLFSNTIELAGPLPFITDPLEIVGGPLVTPTVDGNDIAALRVLVIDTDDMAPVEEVELTQLIVRGGNGASAGGGVSSTDAALTISSSLLESNNTSSGGGGVYAASGTLAIQNSTISSNTSGSQGAGVNTTVPTNITRSTISANHTTGAGGAGGGISSGGNLTLESSTVSGNYTEALNGFGGGLSVSGGPITVYNSTISGNHVDQTASDGGGIYAQGVDPLVNGTIVANNAAGATGQGPDLFDVNPADNFQMDYSLVENTADAAPIVETVAGSNVTGVDPDLGPLDPNGGQTLTHLPNTGSPVLDQGATDEVTDQRGAPRPSDFSTIANEVTGDGADIGAVEVQSSPPSFSAISPTSPNIDDTPTITGTLSAFPEVINNNPMVQLYTAAGCGVATGPPTSSADFLSPGITVGPVPHDATTTFHGTTTTAYGTSLCSAAGISYTQADPPVPVTPVSPAPTALLPGATGQRAAALARCKKKKRKARKKCRKKAAKLPA